MSISETDLDSLGLVSLSYGNQGLNPDLVVESGCTTSNGTVDCTGETVQVCVHVLRSVYESVFAQSVESRGSWAVLPLALLLSTVRQWLLVLCTFRVYWRGSVGIGSFHAIAAKEYTNKPWLDRGQIWLAAS